MNIKIDGCLSGDTLVVTKKGSKRFDELTMDDFVKCIDLDEGKIHWCRETHPRSKDGLKRWLQVRLLNGSSFKLTEDHEILTQSSHYIEAKSIVGERLYELPDEDTYTPKVPSLVTEVKFIPKELQYDLTTPYSNFVILVGDREVVVHNSSVVASG